MSPELVQQVLEEALQQGCGRPQLDSVEQSQLTLAFHKVISLGGMSIEKFEEQVRSPTMFGPDITKPEVEHLFVLYTSCWRASPEYMSKNKQSGKHKKRSAPASSSTSMAEPPFCAVGIRTSLASHPHRLFRAMSFGG